MSIMHSEEVGASDLRWDSFSSLKPSVQMKLNNILNGKKGYLIYHFVSLSVSVCYYSNSDTVLNNK